MAAPWQGLPVRLERAPHRGAAFALSNASKRARIRSIGSRSRGSLFIGSGSRGSLFIFRSSPAVAPPGPSLPCRPRPRLAKALAAGCDDFDTKPVELQRLLGKIRALMPAG